jgi:hypothetical protein
VFLSALAGNPTRCLVREAPQERSARSERDTRADGPPCFATKGTFAARVDTAFGITPIALATADLHGDGMGDLAAVDSSQSTVSMLFGTCGP